MINFQFRHVTFNYILKSVYKNYGTISDIRVRFAPSPTGSLHLGGLRTALYNYLFAKGKNGKFIIRIEDTDQNRLKPKAKDQLLQDLKWAGIEADEDPIKGGPYAPYIQSERKEFYNVQANLLLKTGHAYRCFCSERRLELLRKECIKSRQVPKYDNKCRSLSLDDVSERLAKREPHCIRFKMLDEPILFNDIIFGEHSYNVAEQEGDPVIMKTDGLPTYHFANVVDDHFMKISHVFRGSEWLSSTNKHIMIYKAFEWDPPFFGHLPLLLNADGTKLSKRQDTICIDYYRRTGILPMALINFVTEQGGGFKRDWKHRTCFSMEELTNKFNIEDIGKSSGRLNFSILSEYNKLELVKQIQDPGLKTQLLKKLETLIKTKYPNKIKFLQLDKKHLEDVLLWSMERINSLEDLVTKDLEFLWVVPKNDEFWITKYSTIECIVTELEKLNEFTSLNIKTLIHKICTEKYCKPSEVMVQIRKSLSGVSKGPGVAEMIEILGKHISIMRLKSALVLHEKHKEKIIDEEMDTETFKRNPSLETLGTYKLNSKPQRHEITNAFETIKTPEVIKCVGRITTPKSKTPRAPVIRKTADTHKKTGFRKAAEISAIHKKLEEQKAHLTSVIVKSPASVTSVISQAPETSASHNTNALKSIETEISHEPLATLKTSNTSSTTEVQGSSEISSQDKRNTTETVLTQETQIVDKTNISPETQNVCEKHDSNKISESSVTSEVQKHEIGDKESKCLIK